MFWLGAGVSLCYVPGFTGAYIATQWPVLAVVLSFGLLRHGPFNVFHALGLAFVAYAFALWPFSPVPYASVFGLWLIVIMGLSLWFGSTIESTRELYAGLAVGAAVSSAVAVLQYFGFDAIATAGAKSHPGIYVNGVQQGTVLALVAVALVSERMWWWLPPLVPGLVLAQSRGAWVALAVGALGCYVRRLWLFSAVLAAGVLYLVFTPSVSDLERLFFWRFAWDNLTWFGWGPGVFYTIVLPRDGTLSLYPEYAHNDAIQLAFEYGCMAALPFAIFGYALWRTDAKEWPLVLAFVVAGCYSMPLFMPLASFLGLVAVGRVLRSYGATVSDGDHSRQHVVSWRRTIAGVRRQAVSLAPHHSAKG